MYCQLTIQTVVTQMQQLWQAVYLLLTLFYRAFVLIGGKKLFKRLALFKNSGLMGPANF